MDNEAVERQLQCIHAAYIRELAALEACLAEEAKQAAASTRRPPCTPQEWQVLLDAAQRGAKAIVEHLVSTE